MRDSLVIGAGRGCFGLARERAAGIDAATPMHSPTSLYQIKVTLKDTTPAIWRRLLIPGDTTLAELHHLLQVAVGWTRSRCAARGRSGAVRPGAVGILRIRDRVPLGSRVSASPG